MGSGLVVESRAFPLRPVPDPTVRFKGTYREEGWRRCAEMSRSDAIAFTPWPHAEFPNWSLPALEAAKCVAAQGDDLFECVHLNLYRAFFTESRNIADERELERIVQESGADLNRFRADYRAGVGRESVMNDTKRAVEEHGVRGIPTVIVAETGRTLVGLAELSVYRAAVEEAAG